MLLRGVKLARPVLNQADKDATRKGARNSGRSHGGAPLRNGNGHGGGYGNGRGGRINYADQGMNQNNPFAAHLQPGYGPPPSMGGGRPGGDWRNPQSQGHPPHGNGYGPPSGGYAPPGGGYGPPPGYGAAPPQGYPIAPPPGAYGQQPAHGYGRPPPPPNGHWPRQ